MGNPQETPVLLIKVMGDPQRLYVKHYLKTGTYIKYTQCFIQPLKKKSVAYLNIALPQAAGLFWRRHLVFYNGRCLLSLGVFLLNPPPWMQRRPIRVLVGDYMSVDQKPGPPAA